MPLLLQRNSSQDPWFTTYDKFIDIGEIVKLESIVEGATVKEGYPPEIYVTKLHSADKYNYKASLSCFDYVGVIYGS